MASSVKARRSRGSRDPSTGLTRILESAADLTLFVDEKAKITDVVVGGALEPASAWKKLSDRRWAQALTIESQPKVDPLLSEARAGRPSKPRELNMLVDGVGEVPFRFTAVRLEESPYVVALGRDLRPIQGLQQRLVAAQQDTEREIERIRQADTRYRVLFHVTREGVLVVDFKTQRILEVNPAASGLLEAAPGALHGKLLADLFEPSQRAALHALLGALDAGKPATEKRLVLADRRERELAVAASLFRQGPSALLLVRMSPPTDAPVPEDRASRMLAAVEALPDGLVMVAEDRKIIAANNAFCELVQRASEKHVVGEPLDRWLGRPGVDLNIIVANVREHGVVKNFSTIVRSDFGVSQEALVTAVAALDSKMPCLAFSIRPVSAQTSRAREPAMPRSVEQLRELVGRVSLKELVRESADMVERLCIEAALNVSNNNRASAAELLGLSRQGLYSKLRRYGLEEFEPPPRPT